MRVLLPVSRDEGRAAALALCADVARAPGAEVAALFVVDRAGIARAEAGAHIGSIRLAQEAEARIAEREAAAGRAALDEAAACFRAAGIPFAAELAEGDPAEALPRAAALADLVVTGALSVFGYREEEPGRVALSVMKARAAPLLLSARSYRPVRTVVVGCGGGARTSAAVSALARLGLWKSGPRLLLLAVDDSAEQGERRLSDPRRILADAGYAPSGAVTVPGPKLEAFARALDAEEADAVVLGGFGEHRWNDLFGGSVTGMLLDEAGRHLFLCM